MAQIAGSEFRTNASQEVHELRASEASLDFHFAETKHTGATVQRLCLDGTRVLGRAHLRRRSTLGTRRERSLCVELGFDGAGVFHWFLLRPRGIWPPWPLGLREREGRCQCDEDGECERSSVSCSNHAPPPFFSGLFSAGFAAGFGAAALTAFM